MCGRYVSPDQAAMEREWHVGRANSNPFPRRFNVAPTTLVPILRLDRGSDELELTAARWGLIPHWWKDAKIPVHTIDARSEDAATKPMWRAALRNWRCLIPAGMVRVEAGPGSRSRHRGGQAVQTAVLHPPQGPAPVLLRWSNVSVDAERWRRCDAELLNPDQGRGAISGGCP